MSNFLGFPKKLIPALVCQKDYQPLKIANSSDGDFILDGALICPRCSAAYEIKHGVLNLLAGQKKLNGSAADEAKARDRQAESYNQRLSPRYYKEVEPTLISLGDLTGKIIIEYACGTGRFTLELEKRAESILAADFSPDSLYYLAKNLKNNGVGLVLADATQLVTAADYFDQAFSAQFLEHVNKKEAKDSFLANVKNTLKPDGIFVCTVYHQDLRRKIKKLPREGYHDGGIFYHYFGRRELREDFSGYFRSADCRPIDTTLPLESRLGLTEKSAGRLSVVLSRLPLINQFAHLLLIKARK